MAIYHMSVKMGQRSAGQSSVASAAYRSGEELLDERTGESFDYKRKGGIVASGILTPDDAPAWASDRSKLWNKVEASEKRKDAQVYREFEAALPAELTTDQQRDLVVNWVDTELLSRGMICDVNIHDTKKGNPHVHIQATTRKLAENGEGFGGKEREWNAKPLLKEWRKSWGIAVNQSLEMAGHESRVDHRSHRERGVEMEPQLHHGNRSGLRMKNEAIKSRNVERVVLDKEQAQILADADTRIARTAEVKRALGNAILAKAEVTGQVVKTVPGINSDWLILRDEAGIEHRARLNLGEEISFKPGDWVCAKPKTGLEGAELSGVEDPALARAREQAAADAEIERQRLLDEQAERDAIADMEAAKAAEVAAEQKKQDERERKRREQSSEMLTGAIPLRPGQDMVVQLQGIAEDGAGGRWIVGVDPRGVKRAAPCPDEMQIVKAGVWINFDWTRRGDRAHFWAADQKRVQHEQQLAAMPPPAAPAQAQKPVKLPHTAPPAPQPTQTPTPVKKAPEGPKRGGHSM